MKLSTLAAAVHPYPTLGEINKRVVGAYLSPKIFSDKVKKGLKFFFHLKGRACGLGGKPIMEKRVAYRVGLPSPKGPTRIVGNGWD